MKREIITTADGSTTIHLPEWNEHYHSKHGAIQEAYHVFIKHGLYHVYRPGQVSGAGQQISILEMGFGTGLNAFITLLEAGKHHLNVNYVGVEGYPVSPEEVRLLNYSSKLNVETTLFNELHELSWGHKHQISDNFSITKCNKLFDQVDDLKKYELIYFDAFGARVQPELWTEPIFKKMYSALKDKGFLVTYSAKGSVRRAMQSVGFTVEKLPGPPGKREMLRGSK